MTLSLAMRNDYGYDGLMQILGRIPISLSQLLAISFFGAIASLLFNFEYLAKLLSQSSSVLA